MSQKSKISGPEKIAAVEKYLRGEDSINHLATLLNVHNQTLTQWVNNYQSLGPEALLDTSKNIIRSLEFKIIVVEDYLVNGGSHMEICKRHGVKSTKQLRTWILQYNGHEKSKTSEIGGMPIMTKGRKTTYDERIEIVKNCIENQNNYEEISHKFQVSYQQVYSWTNKYLKGGIEALQDRRGKRKFEDEMSELDKLKAQNKLLEAVNKGKQMEIDLLKKLKELEWGWF